MRPTTTNKQQNDRGADPSHAPLLEHTPECPCSPGSQKQPANCPGADPDNDEVMHDEWLLFEAWRVGLQ